MGSKQSCRRLNFSFNPFLLNALLKSKKHQWKVQVKPFSAEGRSVVDFGQRNATLAVSIHLFSIRMTLPRLNERVASQLENPQRALSGFFKVKGLLSASLAFSILPSHLFIFTSRQPKCTY